MWAVKTVAGVSVVSTHALAREISDSWDDTRAIAALQEQPSVDRASGENTAHASIFFLGSEFWGGEHTDISLGHVEL